MQQIIIVNLILQLSKFSLRIKYCLKIINFNYFRKINCNIFIEELQKNNNFKDQKFEDALRETFLKMDELLLTPEGQNEINEMKDNNGTIFAGCTANVALFYKNTLYVANAGDSRSVLCRENKNYDMSVDHKPENYEEKLRIEKAGGYVSDGRVNGNLCLNASVTALSYINKIDFI
ncbi:unnamed protein product [Paramecium pentaurelia]|uniref:protein-serine/threonine phosphatase n=1 Tax=Paramecium pentaurelia TaxID=43138 RepID=A0A8S1VHC7_9CILI|nr:unnamed protein product [Paramecium pentaurelia]